MISSPVALVTGASRGLGRAIALSFAEKGYSVGVNYVLDDQEALKTKDSIEKQGGQALLLKADVRSSAEVNGIVDQLVKTWGRLDVLVNNAGLTRDRSLFKMTDEEWRDVMSVNLDGAFFCTRAALGPMRARKTGAIVNISSYVTHRAVFGTANYAASKAGLIALTKSTAVEEGAHNIRANVVLPGFHVTDMNKHVWEKYEDQIRGQHLLKKMAQKEELSDFVVRVSELESVTGQVFAFESRLL